eukprot:403369267
MLSRQDHQLKLINAEACDNKFDQEIYNNLKQIIGKELSKQLPIHFFVIHEYFMIEYQRLKTKRLFTNRKPQDKKELEWYFNPVWNIDYTSKFLDIQDPKLVADYFIRILEFYPLYTKESAKKFNIISKKLDYGHAQQIIEEIRSIISDMIPVNKAKWRFVLHFLRIIEEQSQYNDLTMEKLSQIFFKILFKAEDQMIVQDQYQALLIYMIRCQDEIFEVFSSQNPLNSELNSNQQPDLHQSMSFNSSVFNDLRDVDSESQTIDQFSNYIMNERDLPSNNRESLQTFKSVQIMSVDTDEVVSRAHSVGGIQEQNRNRVMNCDTYIEQRNKVNCDTYIEM